MAIKSERESLDRRIAINVARATVLEQRALNLPPGHVLRDLIHSQLAAPGLLRSQAARDRDKAKEDRKKRPKARNGQ